jgi:uncharacterized delta-60 repeat protein
MTRSGHYRFPRVILSFVVVLGEVLASQLANAAPGNLDTTFAGDGTVTTAPAQGGGIAKAVAIQPDGKIVAAGQTLGRKPRLAVVRYTGRGKLDTDFGRDGTVITDVSRGGDRGNDVAIQSDGKIVVAGRSGRYNHKFALVRYTLRGALDSTFAEDGTLTTDFTDTGDAANAVAIQPDGKIVAVGQAGGAAFALARYNIDGSMDPTFGGDGTVTTDFPGRMATANAVAIQPDGKILSAGVSAFRPALARYNSDGTLDPTFGGDGKVTLGVACCPSFVAVNDVAIQPGGQIVTAGEWFECFGPGDCEADAMLTRYNADGTLDTTFSGDGIAFVNGSANALAIQADGKIVAAGWIERGFGAKAQTDFLVARFDPDGTHDGTFGKEGEVLTSFTPNVDRAEDIALQSDGKIVAAGGAAVFGPHPTFAVARYLLS